MKDKNFNCQMSHIVMGLSVVVAYKVLKHFKLFQKEGFETKKERFIDEQLNSSILNFIDRTSLPELSSQQVGSLSTTDYNNYVNTLNNVRNGLDSLKQILIQQSQDTNNNQVNNPDSLSLRSQQELQAFKIDFLSKQIKNAQQIINAQKLAETSNNYPPIKVLSSCSIPAPASAPATKVTQRQ
jgi:hypothetical protein